MTDTKHAARVELQRVALKLIVDVSTGKLGRDLSSKPFEEWTDVLAELERQCPGHSKDTYRDVLARASWNNR
jgi:hypothetical protein